jgi:hypothetical protein
MKVRFDYGLNGNKVYIRDFAMNEMKKGLILILIGFFACLTLASGQILIGQTKGTYSLGDLLESKITITASEGMSDYAIASIVCNSGSSEFYKVPFSLKAGESKTIELNLKIDNFIVGNLNGNCVIEAVYSSERAESQPFHISREVSLNLNEGSYTLEPGQNFVISGSAIKKNNQGLEGFAKAIIENSTIESYGFVINGSFSLNMTLPAEMEAGEYSIKARVYDTNSKNEILNEGVSYSTLRVLQVVKRLDIALNLMSATIGDELNSKFFVYDQTGKEMEKEVGIALYGPNKELKYSGNLMSGEGFSLEINSNYTPGAYYFESRYGNYYARKEVEIKPSMRIEALLQDNKILIKNIGNVPYDKEIEIGIGENKEKLHVVLGLNEEKLYRLSAPEGSYDISVNDGIESKNLGGSVLTGRAISISENGAFTPGTTANLILWIVAILVIALVGFYLFRKIRKRNLYGHAPAGFKIIGTSRNPVKSAEGPSRIRPISEFGDKQMAGVVAIKIKNYEELRNSTSNAFETIESALSCLRNTGAKVVSNIDSTVAIFSPNLTNSSDNAFIAVSAAKQAEKILKEHNNKFSQKIKFGIGVNVGEFIIESRGGEHLFTPMSGSVIAAKKLASFSNEDVLLSESARSRTLSSVKAEKISEAAWRVLRFVERDKSSQFIEGFMRRQAGDK